MLFSNPLVSFKKLVAFGWMIDGTAVGICCTSVDSLSIKKVVTNGVLTSPGVAECTEAVGIDNGVFVDVSINAV